MTGTSQAFSSSAAGWLAAALVVAAGALAAAGSGSQANAHRVVFEVTSDGDEAWTSVLNNVANLQQALGAESTEIRVVAHGKGIGLVRTMNTALAPRIASLSSPRVRFLACENTMKRLKISRDDLLPGVGTVDFGRGGSRPPAGSRLVLRQVRIVGMYPVIFRIGTFEITSFGVMVAVGAAVGYAIFARELERAGFPGLGHRCRVVRPVRRHRRRQAAVGVRARGSRNRSSISCSRVAA